MGECIIRNFLTNFSKRLKIKITSHIHQNSFPSLSFSPILPITPHQKKTKPKNTSQKNGRNCTKVATPTHRLGETPLINPHLALDMKPNATGATAHSSNAKALAWAWQLKKQTFSQPERGTQ